MNITVTAIDEMDFDDLLQMVWGGAQDTLSVIIHEGKGEELVSHLTEIKDSWDKVELNDYLTFEDDAIFEALEIEVE